MLWSARCSWPSSSRRWEIRLCVRSPAATRSAALRAWFSGMMICRVMAQAAIRPNTRASTVLSNRVFLAWAASVSRTTVCDSVSFLLSSSRTSP
ncbi:hypothetical protein D3C76_1688400 [compost metagenome]